MKQQPDHEKFMTAAIKEAEYARSKDEVPIGAVVVHNSSVIARAYNMVETLNDPTAHAEMQAITMATNYIGGKYLEECTLYVTVEPCPMCASALYLTHIGRVVYGAKDPKRGYSMFEPSLLHPKTEIIGGILESKCSELITDFFRAKR